MITMYLKLGIKGQMYGWVPDKYIKTNSKGDIYVGECTQEDFSENVRRLMHKKKWPLEQVLAISFSMCERGTAHAEGEEKED